MLEDMFFGKIDNKSNDYEIIYSEYKIKRISAFINFQRISSKRYLKELFPFHTVKKLRELNFEEKMNKRLSCSKASVVANIHNFEN